MKRIFLACLLSLAGGVGAQAAISVVQFYPPAVGGTQCGTQTYSVYVITCAFASLPTANNAVWVGIGTNATTGSFTVTDNQTTGNSYTSQVSNVGASTTWVWFMTPAVALDGVHTPFVVTANTPAVSSSYPQMVIIEVANQLASGPLDTTAFYNNTGGTSPSQCGTLTTGTANDLVLAGIIAQNWGTGNAVASAGSGDSTTYALAGNGAPLITSTTGGASVYGVVGTASNYKPQIGSSTGGFGTHTQCVSVAIKPAASSIAYSFTISPTSAPTPLASPSGIVFALSGTGSGWATGAAVTATVAPTGTTCGTLTILSTTSATVTCSTGSATGTLTLQITQSGYVTESASTSVAAGGGGAYAGIGG